MSLLNKMLNRKEKFAAEVGIGVIDDFASVVKPSAVKVDVAMMIEHPEELYVMQVFVPKIYDAVKIDCRTSEVYPIKRTITPRYTCYQQAKNDIRKDINDAIRNTPFEMLTTSTVKDGGENIDRYEIDFLLDTSKNSNKNIPRDYINIEALPLLIAIVDPHNAKRKYGETDYMARTVDGIIEIVNGNSGEIIRKPQF